MDNSLIHHHIKERLKIVFLVSIASFIVLFVLVFFLGKHTEVDTFYTEIFLLAMSAIAMLTYIALIVPSAKVTSVPIFTFIFLNILTSVLVWSTGILQSPFVILHVIIIIVGTQLYRYTYGLLQVLLAFVGYVVIYGSVTHGILPFLSLLPYSGVSILFQPPMVIIIYGLLYAMLLLFTVMSSSNARMMIYRPENRVSMDVTYQERIIQDMPIGVLVVDSSLTILGNNPWSEYHFFVDRLPAELKEYLYTNKKDLKRELYSLAKSTKNLNVTWKSNAGEKIKATISARLMRGEKKSSDTFVIFIW